MPVTLRFADPDEALAAVRLASDLHLSDEQRSFKRDGDGWVLEAELPDVQRLEYMLELEHPDGGVEHILDPANDKRAPGAFGEKSVLELPGYEAPAWLDAKTAPGRTDDLSVRGRGLGANVDIRVWAPEDAPPGRPLRMLLANDGPEYDALSQLTRYAGAMIAGGELPPFRVALLSPGDRNQWYSASAAYSRVLDHDVVPALREAFGVVLQPAAMGASPRRRARAAGALGGGPPAGGEGREPRRAGDARRAAAVPARARRAVPA